MAELKKWMVVRGPRKAIVHLAETKEVADKWVKEVAECRGMKDCIVEKYSRS